jgi:stage II sporulation protein P
MMKERKNVLRARQERARIEGSKRENKGECFRKRQVDLKSWYKIYMITTVSTVFLMLLLLLVGFSNDVGFSLPSADDIASFFISNEFIDISGAPLKHGNNTSGSHGGIFDIMDGIMIPSRDESDSDSVIVPDKNAPVGDSGASSAPSGSIYDFDYSKVPVGESAVIPMDLSLTSYGSAYIYNSTGYSPNAKALLAAKLSFSGDAVYISSQAEPLVLILHTHATESYLPDGSVSYRDTGGEMARSDKITENVVAVGDVMARILNENGIPTLHCTLLHDNPQYKDSYARAEETIKQYLTRYPSIKLVIDLHRDAVIKSTGEIVRPVTEINGEATAQVMCVVGSDWNGYECDNWEDNLALALQLRERLNSKYASLCRPTYLRASTYNQELAPYSLLLEVGACGNSLEEAKRAANLVANELVSVIKSSI